MREDNILFDSKEEIEKASREDIVRYLEGWGFAVYDNEGTEYLRDAAVGCFQAEADGLL